MSSTFPFDDDGGDDDERGFSRNCCGPQKLGADTTDNSWLANDAPITSIEACYFNESTKKYNIIAQCICVYLSNGVTCQHELQCIQCQHTINCNLLMSSLFWCFSETFNKFKHHTKDIERILDHTNLFCSRQVVFGHWWYHEWSPWYGYDIYTLSYHTSIWWHRKKLSHFSETFQRIETSHKFAEHS